MDQSVDILYKAKRVYEEWTRMGRKTNVKFLLPKIDIKGGLHLKNCGTMKKSNVWLGGIGRGMTWDEHMEVAVAESRAKLGAPLFALGGANGFF